MIKPLIKFFLKRSLKEQDRAPSKVQGAHIMRVAVVAEYRQDESFQHVLSYVKEWRKRGMRTVDFYIYFPHKKQFEAYQGSLKDVPFMRNHFNWIGRVKSAELASSLKESYDVAIDLSRGASFACDVILAKIDARWKAGEQDMERAYLLDLMIDVKQDPDVRKLIHHLDHYVNHLNTPNAA